MVPNTIASAIASTRMPNSPASAIRPTSRPSSARPVRSRPRCFRRRELDRGPADPRQIGERRQRAAQRRAGHEARSDREQHAGGQRRELRSHLSVAPTARRRVRATRCSTPSRDRARAACSRSTSSGCAGAVARLGGERHAPGWRPPTSAATCSVVDLRRRGESRGRDSRLIRRRRPTSDPPITTRAWVANTATISASATTSDRIARLEHVHG